MGAELALVSSKYPGIATCLWALGTRFIVMPALGLGFVWATAGRGLYVNDTLVWYVFQILAG